MALNAMRQARASDQVRELIELRRKASHEWATSMEQAHLEGLEKGVEKGRKEGVCEMARRMRREGMASDVISRLTGLSPEEFEE